MKEILEQITAWLGEDAVLRDEPMKQHTSFKIGGPATAVVLPDNEGHLADVIALLRREGVRYEILGNGTNVLFPDEGFDGIVVKLADNFAEIAIDGTRVSARAGALLSKVSKLAAKASLTGLEFASGIPGTLGGAVVMNAGAYDGEMKDVVVQVTVLTPKGEIQVLEKEELEFGYRTSAIRREGYTVLSTVMELREGDPQAIRARMDELNQKRTSRQPLHLPSAGSTFKRPEGNYAGKLIEDAGLKGLVYGGAQVSEKHCGFVVNIDNATCREVTTLMQLVQDTVYEKFGVRLEPEVKIIKGAQHASD